MYNVKTGVIAGMAVAVAMLASGVANADDGSTVGELGKIQSNTLVLKAKVREQEALGELKSKSVGETRGPSVSDSVSTVLPNVKMISSGEAGPYAVLLYADGSTSAGGVGRKLPGGLTIANISAMGRSVEVTDANGKRQTLGMSSNAPMAPVVQQSIPVVQPTMTFGAPALGRPR